MDANATLGLYDRHKMRRHVERIERRLLARTFSPQMSKAEKLSLILRYISISSVFKMMIEECAGCYD